MVIVSSEEEDYDCLGRVRKKNVMLLKDIKSYNKEKERKKEREKERKREREEIK